METVRTRLSLLFVLISGPLPIVAGCGSSAGGSEADTEAETEAGTEADRPSSGSASGSGPGPDSGSSRGDDGPADDDDGPTADDDGDDDDDDDMVDDGTDDAGATCQDYGEPCSQCELQACPDIYCECYGEPDCGLLAQCYFACAPGDTACTSACSMAYPDGNAVGALLSDCAAVSCSDTCSYLGPLVELTDCERCVYEDCAQEVNDCAAVGTCPELLVCVAACAGDTACETSCAQLYPLGVNQAVVVGNCTLDFCEEVCA